MNVYFLIIRRTVFLNLHFRLFISVLIGGSEIGFEITKVMVVFADVNLLLGSSFDWLLFVLRIFSFAGHTVEA